MKMMKRKLAMPLLGVLLWVISIHAGTFAAATLLPRPITGVGRSLIQHHHHYQHHHHHGSIKEQSDEFPLTSLHSTLSMKIPEKDLNRSVIFGNGVISRMLRLETNLGWSDIHVRPGTPSHGQLIASSPEREALKQGRDALIATKATIHLMNNFCYKHGLNLAECSKYIATYSLIATPLESACKALHKTCTPEELLSKYRSIDGSCNHKIDGSRGVSFTSYKRLLYPEYLDGVQEPRRSINKKPLPSPRLISTSIVKRDNQRDRDDSDLTLAVMQWSQFIEHDLSHTPISKMIHTEKPIECCATSGSNLSPRYIHPFCSPIPIPYDDQDYSQHSLDCMTYVRSVAAFRSDCSFGPIEQLNQATHYLDASQIYGTNNRIATRLRAMIDGQLYGSHKDGKTFLPISSQPTIDCQFINKNSHHCYLSGDSRVNVHPQSSVMSTLWLREHNRITSILKQLNPNWDDEILYQEARRIVIAQIQHITYDEWIPIVLGRRYSNKLQRFDDYDERIDPSVSNSFATAALRVLDSLMDDKLKLYLQDRRVNITLNLRDYFNKPEIIEDAGYLDAIVRGLATQSSRKLSNFVDDMTSNLFSNGIYGYDIVSLDIQRGRDHGLPGYTAYRTLCGLSEAHDFDDLLDVISFENVKVLSDVYSNVNDIDLIVGGILEKPSGDSLFGPTFSCIVADQFLRTRRGDRYFYKNDQQPAPFSTAQLREIDKVTLARIFCDNGDNIKRMQPFVFKNIEEYNELMDCEEIPKMDLQVWLDNRETYY